ncbi:MAG: cation-translocating P-type ATPase [Firmicutes bacterium]|nr:cation-translocating P-type ATPase [Bacillota bacterium]
MRAMEDAYQKNISEALSAAQSSREGLSQREAALRLSDGGENRITEADRPGALARFGRQLLDPMVLVLLAAAAVSGLIGELADTLIILLVVLANSLLGVYQEGKAERAVEALSRLNAPQALVRREGHSQRIKATELVVGDVVLLNAGDRVPADLRLLEAMELRVDQSSLTGESQPVGKDALWLPEQGAKTAPAERANMLFMGSPVLWGRGEGLVTAVGDDTQTGHIARMLQDTESKQTPLQKRLAELSRILSFAVLGICLLIFIISLIVAEDHSILTLIDSLLLALSLAVAAIPEGLVVVVTLVLALGMNAISARGGMIRRLNAVETLGATSVICSDKTGTLTQNRMAVVEQWGLCREGLLAAALCNSLPEDWQAQPGEADRRDAGSIPGATGNGQRGAGFSPGFPLARKSGTGFSFDGASYEQNNAGFSSNGTGSYGRSSGWNTGRLQSSQGKRRSAISGGKAFAQPEAQPPLGDPTEEALARYAAAQGLQRPLLQKEYPLLQELPFDSSRKRMSTRHRDGQRSLVLAKGAPELLLSCCDRQADARGRIRSLDEAAREAILSHNREMAGRGLRVLALAFRPQEGEEALREEGLIFAGLLGLADPPRPGVKQALAAAKQAGIRTVMVSGDNLETATAIGAELGIYQPGDLRLTGAELDALSEEELTEILPRCSILARVKPEDKLRIVRGWQSLGKVTAMTGDGVNDAPALKAADIGVGMGLSGSEVSKSVSALVLADDDYSTILSAVGEGRRIYENIRKALQFLLASNLAEVLVIFLASILGQQIFLPIHLLWINLVTDCFPAIALGTEEPEPNSMAEPPRPAGESVFSRGLGQAVLRQGLLLALLCLASFFLGQQAGAGLGMSMAFLTLSTGELAHSWNMRSRSASIFSLPRGNRLLALATGLSLLLGLGLIYLPPLQALFRLSSLSLPQLAAALGLGLSIIPLVELEKRLLSGERRTREAQ